jgi:hypothetical protein
LPPPTADTPPNPLAPPPTNIAPTALQPSPKPPQRAVDPTGIY